MDRLKQAKLYSMQLSKLIQKYDKENYLYVIHLPFRRMYKVGITSNLEQRLNDIKKRYNEPLAKVMAKKEGTFCDEKLLHKRLHKYRAVIDDLDFNPTECYNIHIKLTDFLSDYFNENVFYNHLKNCFDNSEEIINHLRNVQSSTQTYQKAL